MSFTECTPKIVSFTPASTNLVAKFSDSPRAQPVVGFFTIDYPGTYPGLMEPGGYPTSWLPNAEHIVRTRVVAAVARNSGVLFPVTESETFEELCAIYTDDE